MAERGTERADPDTIWLYANPLSLQAKHAYFGENPQWIQWDLLQITHASAVMYYC